MYGKSAGKGTLMAIGLVLALMWTAAPQPVLAAAAPTSEATFDKDAFATISATRGDEIKMEGCALRVEEVGAPDLPVKVHRVIVPANYRVTGVTVTRAEYEPLVGTYNVVPVDPPTPLDGSVEPQMSQPDPQIYGSPAAYPASPVEIVGDGFFFGYHVITLHVVPLRYFPTTGKLELLTVLEFDLDGEDQLYDGIDPIRRTELSDMMARQTVEGYVANAAEIATLGPDLAVEAVNLGPGNLVPSPWPSDIGPPVDFVIVTDASLVSIFEPLRAWKHSKGWVSVIKTVQDIQAQYAGVDTQEQIRNFIIDAGAQWGTMFFLLGGDVNYVPARFGMWNWYGSGGWGPTDLYYATIGTWDPDGDGVFGEDEEWQGCDYEIDFHVGRAPVENAAEAEIFVDKVLGYELNPPLGFCETALFMGASIGSGTDTWGQSTAEYIITNYLPAWFDYWRLYNILWVGDELLTSATATAHLQIGYHYNYHADHSSSGSMGTGYTHGGGTIGKTTVSNLTNGDRQGIFISLGCSPNAFDYDSISERFLNNPNGGTAAYMGNTRIGWSSQTPQARALYREIFNNHITKLGHAFSLARAELDGPSTHKYYYCKNQNLLGDPTMMVYTINPTPLAATHPAVLYAGPQDFTVQVTNPYLHPLEDAVVCLSKEDEIYAVGTTGLDGRVTLPVNCLTHGELDITATKDDYIPYQATIPAGPPISGFITWPNGDPASHVTVKLISMTCQGQWTTTTDDAGFYSFNAVPDTYDIRAERRVNCTTYRRNVCPVTYNGTPIEKNMTLIANGPWRLCPYLACDDILEKEAGPIPDEDLIPMTNLYGTVKWNCGVPLEVAPYVTITAKKVCSSEKYTTETNINGMYYFYVTPGQYNITARIRVNGVTYTAQKCNVTVGQSPPAVVDLVVKSGAPYKVCFDCAEELPEIHQE